MGRKPGIDLKELQMQVSAWAEERWPDRSNYKKSLDLPFYRLVASAGGLSAIVSALAEGVLFDPDQDERIDPDICRDEFRRLLGELVVYATEAAGRNGWNISNIVDETWREMRGEDWIRFPRPGRPKETP